MIYAIVRDTSQMPKISKDLVLYDMHNESETEREGEEGIAEPTVPHSLQTAEGSEKDLFQVSYHHSETTACEKLFTAGCSEREMPRVQTERNFQQHSNFFENSEKS